MTIYQKLKRIAKPVIKAYHDDLAVHDLKALRAMRPGETALWTCREHGTHFIWLARKDDKVDAATLESHRNGLNYFDAVAKVFGNTDGSDKWYLLEKTGASVIPLTAIEARQLYVERIRSIGAAVARAA